MEQTIYIKNYRSGISAWMMIFVFWAWLFLVVFLGVTAFKSSSLWVGVLVVLPLMAGGLYAVFFTRLLRFYHKIHVTISDHSISVQESGADLEWKRMNWSRFSWGKIHSSWTFRAQDQLLTLCRSDLDKSAEWKQLNQLIKEKAKYYQIPSRNIFDLRITKILLGVVLISNVVAPLLLWYTDFPPAVYFPSYMGCLILSVILTVMVMKDMDDHRHGRAIKNRI